MARRYCWIPVTFALLMLMALPSLAQISDSAVLVTSEQGSSVRITIEMDIDGTDFPPEWVGWVVDRTTVGRCDGTVQIGGVTPFPSGVQTYTLTDSSAEEGITYRYRLRAVDAAGNRSFLPGPPMFQPAYYHFDYESVGDGLVFEGVLLDGMPGMYAVEACDGQCWEFLAFVSGAPPELEAGAGTGIVVVIYGELDAEFEGPYISQVTDWAITGTCGTVPEKTLNWGDLKAGYR